MSDIAARRLNKSSSSGVTGRDVVLPAPPESTFTPTTRKYGALTPTTDFSLPLVSLWNYTCCEFNIYLEISLYTWVQTKNINSFTKIVCSQLITRKII